MRKLMIFAAAGLLLASCDEPTRTSAGDDDDSANIDYTAANAASWGNYMAAVSNLLSRDAAALNAAWTESYEGGAAFADVFKNHTGGDYPSARSCVEQIIDGCADIANEVGTAKIGDPYKLYLAGDKRRALYAVESWYSWHSREDYSNNILSIRNAYIGSLDGTVSPASLSAAVGAINPALDSEICDAITAATEAILAIPQPFRANINSPESRAAMTACADLEQVLSVRLKSMVPLLGADCLQQIAENFTDRVVLPTYGDLEARNRALHEAVTALRDAPSDAAFATACYAWLEAREPWEKSEAFLFGPVDALGLDPNMDSWPLDQDAIVQILNSGNYDRLADGSTEAVQSVRGYHTLEFLLFKEGKPRKVSL